MSARDVCFEMTLGVPIPILTEAMPVDMRNLGVSCRALSQVEEVAPHQVFTAENNVMHVRVRLRAEDAALVGIMVGGPAFTATGESTGMVKYVPSHKIQLPSAALVEGVSSVWSVDDSNGGEDRIQVTVRVTRGFALAEVMHLGTQNSAMRIRQTLKAAKDMRNNCISSLFGHAGGPVAALSMLTGQMSVNGGVIGPPRNAWLLKISEPRLEACLREYRPEAGAAGAGPIGQDLPQDLPPGGPGGPGGPSAPEAPGAPAGPDAVATQAPWNDCGLYDAPQVTAIQHTLVEQCLPTYLYMAMPAVYGVAAKLADHLGLPLGTAAQQMQALDAFLQRVEDDPAWTKAVHDLFKVSVAEMWSCRTKYSMDPGVAIRLGPTGAMLVLNGPGEVQDMSGQTGLSCRWLHAKAVDMDTAWNAVGNYDCEDGASLFAALFYAARYSSALHLSQKRDMYTSMPEIMPETDRYCAFTQQCAARILLMVGAHEHTRDISGVSYVSASAASAEQAEQATGGPAGGPEPAPERPTSAIYNTWGRLVGPAPSAGGHAVCIQGTVTGDAATCEIDSKEMGVMKVRIQRLHSCRPLESTALVYPAAPSQDVVLHGVNVRNGLAQSVSVLPDSSTSVSIPRCLSMCSATLAEEAVKMLPADTQASPVFVQAVGTLGFYGGANSVGDHYMFTATNSTVLQRLLNTTRHTVDEPMLKGVCDRANKMTPQQVLEEMQYAELCSWAEYKNMGPAEQPATGVYVMRPTLFEDEEVACLYVAHHAVPEMPSVATLRRYTTPPLSTCEMRQRVLMPPVQCRPAVQPRTDLSVACATPPSEYWGQSVPVMLFTRDSVTGMPTHTECGSSNVTLACGEKLGAYTGCRKNRCTSIVGFHMQHT